MVPSIPFSKWTKGSGRTFGNYENDTKVTKKPFPYFEGTVSTFLKKLKGTVSTFLKKFPQNLFCKKRYRQYHFRTFRTFSEPFQNLSVSVVIYGHIKRSTTGVSKICLEGMIEGKRNRGKPKTRWRDNILSWSTLPDWLSIGQYVQNRKFWRQLSVMSSQSAHAE